MTIASTIVEIGGGPAGFVAFEHDGCAIGYDDSCPITAALYSRDGRSWELADAVEGTFADADINEIIGYGAGFVAVGARRTMVDGAPVTAAAWLSPDGRSWRLASGANLDAGEVATICEGAGSVAGGMHDVAAVGEQLVGLGTTVSEEPVLHEGERLVCPVWRARTWTSADGIAWDRSVMPAGGVDLVFGSIVGGRRYLMSDGKRRIWLSDDGSGWTEVELDVPRRASINELIATDDGYLAFGRRATSDGSEEPITWSSSDGTTWTRFAGGPVPIGWPISAAVINGMVVVVGGFGETLTTEGDFYITTGITTSVDGVTWTQPELEPFEGYELRGVAASRDAVIAVAVKNDSATAALWVMNVR